MKTLKLFNCVVSLDTKSEIHINPLGYIIEKDAMYAKQEILDFYNRKSLDGEDLNKTFYASWKTITESSRYDLFVDQIKHYLTTYGSVLKDEIYIPNDLLNIPDLNLKYKVIKALSKDEIKNKCFNMLNSGIALSEETMKDLHYILNIELKYSYTGNENFKNKEFNIFLADELGILPKNDTELLRYVIYKSTDSTLLIKNRETINSIKENTFNPRKIFLQYGLDKLAPIFNRFKPLFLAYKDKCPKEINKISKLSKSLHKPLPSNPLNEVTVRFLNKDDNTSLDKSTIFNLFKAMNACSTRLYGQDMFTYRIRNGKSFIKEGTSNVNVVGHNLIYLMNYLPTRIDLTNKTYLLPKDIEYALPTSEKMFVGNIPTGTKFTGDNLSVGVYWRNEWGATDLDISGVNIGGKIGWNSSYNQNNGKLLYSGDITDAPNGAVEYLYSDKDNKAPTLVFNNIYSGENDSGYNIIIGNNNKITNRFMMDPKNLLLSEKVKAIGKETILGIYIPDEDTGKQTFHLLNLLKSNNHVSKDGLDYITSLHQQWTKGIDLKDVISNTGGSVIYEHDDNVDYVDLNIDKLNKDTIINIFK